MGFRVVLIENDVFIKMKLDNLVVIKQDDEIWIPIADISVLVLDNLKVTITARILCLLADYNVGVVLCNQEHLPIGFYSSYDNHSRVSKMIGYQIEKSKEYYNQLWQQIVKAKIENQANVLEMLGKSEKVICAIREFIEQVESGDANNREAHVAKLYFNELMGCTFSRGNDNILLNSGLDFGYAILRSFLARLCVGYGLNSQLGIHHCNEYNRFNLVDDMIEPFRPFVDLCAYKWLQNEKYFKPEHRHQLINILNHKMRYKGRVMYICNALEEYVSDIAALFAHRRKEIVYPSIMNYLGEKDEV